MNTIPSGYQLHITSWENDANNYKTKILSGLTKDDVQFYLHFLNHFKSHNSFGNEEVEQYPDAEKIAVTNGYNKCRPTSPQLLKDVEDSIEYWNTSDELEWCDWVYDTIGIWCEGERYRIFDSYEVYLIRTPIPDVTEEFESITELAQ